MSFFNTRVTDRVTEKYINTGKVSHDVIKRIAFLIMEGKELTDNESMIFYGETTQINEIILKLSKLKKCTKE